MVAPQLGGGLFGGIIIQDAIDQLPELASSTERLVVLSDPSVGDSSSVLDVSRMAVMHGREGDATLVNGLSAPTIRAVAGSLEHWRVLNASPSRYYRLALDGHRLHVIGTAGGRLAGPEPVDELLLTPGERTEFLVTPTKAGSFPLRTRGYDRGLPGMGGGTMGGGGSMLNTDEQVLATVAVTGSAAAAAALPSDLAPSSDRDAGTAGSKRPIQLAMDMGGGGNGGMGGGNGGTGDGMGGGGGMMSFTINGASFDPAITNVSVRARDTEDRVITNTSSMDHPFHLHAWPFRVVDRTSGPPDVPGWKDTVNVPANNTVTIRVPFTDITGRTVYHCHILDHEDQGMMGAIQVR